MLLEAFQLKKGEELRVVNNGDSTIIEIHKSKQLTPDDIYCVDESDFPTKIFRENEFVFPFTDVIEKEMKDFNLKTITSKRVEVSKEEFLKIVEK